MIKSILFSGIIILFLGMVAPVFATDWGASIQWKETALGKVGAGVVFDSAKLTCAYDGNIVECYGRCLDPETQDKALKWQWIQDNNACITSDFKVVSQKPCVYPDAYCAKIVVRNKSIYVEENHDPLQ